MSLNGLLWWTASEQMHPINQPQFIDTAPSPSLFSPPPLSSAGSFKKSRG